MLCTSVHFSKTIYSNVKREGQRTDCGDGVATAGWALIRDHARSEQPVPRPSILTAWERGYPRDFIVANYKRLWRGGLMRR